MKVYDILCGMNPDGKVSHRRVNALTNKRDEDPRNESSTLNLLLVNVIAVGFYIPTREATNSRSSDEVAHFLGDSSWTEKQPTAEVLTKLRTFLDLPSIDDDGLFLVQKWIKLLANKLQVELGDYGLDNFPPTKRSHLDKDPEVDVVDGSYNHYA